MADDVGYARRRPVCRAVAELRQAGMSTRAIGQALGVSNSTVHEDAQLFDSEQSPATVTGLDGRKRAGTQRGWR